MAKINQSVQKPRPVVSVLTVTATHAKNSFGEIIRQAYQADQHLIVEKSGIPVVAIVPIADYERMMRLGLDVDSSASVRQAAIRHVAQRQLRETLEEIHARMPPVDDAEIALDVDTAIREVRSKASRKPAPPARRRASKA